MGFFDDLKVYGQSVAGGLIETAISSSAQAGEQWINNQLGTTEQVIGNPVPVSQPAPRVQYVQPAGQLASGTPTSANSVADPVDPNAATVAAQSAATGRVDPNATGSKDMGMMQRVSAQAMKPINWLLGGAVLLLGYFAFKGRKRGK